jgi:hypothetical protein
MAGSAMISILSFQRFQGTETLTPLLVCDASVSQVRSELNFAKTTD